MSTLTRRGFLRGALAAPVVITTPGLLMPVRKLIEQDHTVIFYLDTDANEIRYIGPKETRVHWGDLHTFLVESWENEDKSMSLLRA